MAAPAARARISPRQAVVVLAGAPEMGGGWLARSAPAASDLARARLLDVLAGLRRVDGATVTVATAGVGTARELAPVLPAGVDVSAAPDVPPGNQATWALRDRLAAAFERALVVLAEALPLPPRTVSTALSVLAGADLVLGPTQANGAYLVGARDAAGVEAIAAWGGGSAGDLEARARESGLVLRRLEPRLGFSAIDTDEELRATLAGLDFGTPELDRWLAHRAAGSAPLGNAERDG